MGKGQHGGSSEADHALGPGPETEAVIQKPHQGHGVEGEPVPKGKAQIQLPQETKDRKDTPEDQAPAEGRGATVLLASLGMVQQTEAPGKTNGKKGEDGCKNHGSSQPSHRIFAMKHTPHPN